MEDFLGLPTRELLKAFGAGGHKPGSGSAAALLGLLSAKLCQTVLSLTISRKSYEESADFLGNLESPLRQIGDWLEAAFQRDSEIFHRVIKLRVERDSHPPGSPERRRVLNELARGTWEATDLPMNMVDRLVELGETAIVIFQLGFTAARGDSALAVRAAQAAAGGALAIAHLNLQSTRDRERTRSSLARTANQQFVLTEQVDRFERIEADLRRIAVAKLDDSA